MGRVVGRAGVQRRGGRPERGAKLVAGVGGGHGDLHRVGAEHAHGRELDLVGLGGLVGKRVATFVFTVSSMAIDIRSNSSFFVHIGYIAQRSFVICLSRRLRVGGFRIVNGVGNYAGAILDSDRCCIRVFTSGIGGKGDVKRHRHERKTD